MNKLDTFVALTAAERARAWRARQRAAGQRSGGPSGKHKKPRRHVSAFESGEFVAVDGEGFSEGPELEFRAESSDALYRGRAHHYALLSASDGTELYAPEGRLETQACLDFLLAIKANNKRAIVVCFGASYDITQMLAHGLTREQVTELMRGAEAGEGSDAKQSRRTLDLRLGESDYRLEYRPRKSLTIWRWPAGMRKYILKKGAWRMTPCDKVTLWDVWGFFQDSFVGVMKKWCPDDKDFQFVRQMKGDRKFFDRSEIEEIRRYNQAELRCLALVMDKLRAAVRALGLTISRWDGAGAIAAAINAKEGVKEHKGTSPAEVFEAARYAYSGGHIEVCQIGKYDGTVYHYDVTSAYPDMFRRLPSLAAGRWIHGTGTPPDGFTVVKTRYHFHDGNPFYPLFFREKNGTILYPARGAGWYWKPEYDAAQQYADQLGAKVFEAIEWWHWENATGRYPFDWVDPYFSRRQTLLATSKLTGIDTGEEKIIKLGLNSLYGKTCQQVGARVKDGELVPPAYFQLEWGGYVTAGCRAKLMCAALQNPPAVISFATDAVFSTAPLDLDCPKEKTLGTWEAQTHSGITMVMPGVYWLHEHDGKLKPYSRGFDKEQMVTPDFVHKAWAKKQDHVQVELTRLIGLGSAAMSDLFWTMRGMFVTSTRALKLNGQNSKREGVPMYRAKPHKGLVPTVPRDHLLAELFDPADEIMSEPYSIGWMAEDPDHDRMEAAEIEDAQLA